MPANDCTGAGVCGQFNVFRGLVAALVVHLAVDLHVDFKLELVLVAGQLAAIDGGSVCAFACYRIDTGFGFLGLLIGIDSWFVGRLFAAGFDVEGVDLLAGLALGPRH